MRAAVLGPVCRDLTTIDGLQTLHIGGIPYYVALALRNLGESDVTAYVTASEADSEWVKACLSGVEVKHIPVEKTLESILEYSSKNPDVRTHHIDAYPNTILPTGELIAELENFDYVIFGPLFHDNIPLEFFTRLKHKNLVLGNFGMFTYGEKGEFVRKSPENIVQVLPFLRYLFLDRSEAEFVSGKTDLHEVGKFFRERGLQNMIVTEGSKGSHLFIGGEYYKIPAFTPERIVDPTGAGDTYLAAFIRATELFTNPGQQGRFAAVVATMSLEKVGAFAEGLGDVLKRLK